MSSLTWLDFSDAERKRALQVVELLGRKETRDELGLGTIRDAFADAMFPGMSTVQRRAAYFLLVPWTFQAIERHPRKGWSPLERARRRELQMIDALLAGDDRDGVIGGRAGQRLRQVPSMIYWAGLGRWGIRRVSGTREQWSRAVGRGMPLAVDDDGQIVTGDGGVSWWHSGLPEPPDTFPDGVSLRLRPEDAEYLRTRIMARCPGTVLAALAEREEPWAETTYPWELPMPELDPANGTATVATPAEDLDEPVRFGQRSFTVGLTLDIEALVPFGGGVVLADHVPELEVFPDAATWSARMRRMLVPLTASDAALVERLLSPGLIEPADAITSYLGRIPDHDRSCRA